MKNISRLIAKRVLVVMFLLFGSLQLSAQQHVEWIDLFGANVENDSVLRSKNNSNQWSSRARSSQVLKTNQDGYFQYVHTDDNKSKIIGFAKESGEFPGPLTDVLYGFYQNNFGNRHYYESGSSGVMGATGWDDGDTLKLDRIGDTVRYFVNGLEIRKVAVTISEPWVIKAVQYSSSSFGLTYESVKTDITAKRLNATAILTHDNQGDTLGTIDVTPAGGSGSYTYSWSNGETTQDIDSLHVAIYLDSIFDATDTIVETYQIWQKQGVVWSDLYGVELSNNDTRVTAKAGNLNTWQAKAISSNYLDTLQDGEFELVVNDALTQHMIGFVKEGKRVEDLLINDLIYTFYSTSGNLFARESGTNTLGWYNQQVGDVLRISRIDTVVTYYVNDIPVKESICQRDARWRVACVFSNKWQNEYFDSVKCTFDSEFLYHSYQVTHIDGVNTTGSIDLSVGGGTPPYNYEWSNLATTQDISGLSKGKYSVIIRDKDSSFIIYDTIEVHVRDTVKWAHYQGAVLEGTNNNKIRCHHQLKNWTISKGMTSQHLEPDEDGEFQFEIKDNVTVRQIGFVPESAGIIPTAASLMYALYPYSNKWVYASESGTIYKVWDNLVIGDVLKIRRQGTKLSYYVNEVKVREVTVAPTERWYILADFYGRWVNEYFENVYSSMEKQALHADYTTTDITELKGKGSIDLTVYGGITPYEYIWNTGDTLQDVDSLDVGLYHVSIVDSISDTITYAIPIWEKEEASWDTIVGVSITGIDNDTVTSTSVTVDYTTAQARTIQAIELDENAEFVYIEQYPLQTKVIGLVEDTTATPTGNYNWAAAFYLTSTVTYYGYQDQPWTVINHDNPVVGDVFKITRYDSTVTFLKNGVVQKKLTIHPYGKWYLQVGFLNNQANSKIYDVPVSFVNQTGKFFKKKTYAPLRKKLDGGHFLVEDGKLRFQYDEQYVDQDNDLTYNIYNDYNELVVAATAVALDPAYGDNRFEVDLSCGGIGLNSGFYTLEVINEKNEFLYLRFRNEKNYTCNEGPGATIPPK